MSTITSLNAYLNNLKCLLLYAKAPILDAKHQLLKTETHTITISNAYFNYLKSLFSYENTPTFVYKRNTLVCKNTYFDR